MELLPRKSLISWMPKFKKPSKIQLVFTSCRCIYFHPVTAWITRLWCLSNCLVWTIWEMPCLMLHNSGTDVANLSHYNQNVSIRITYYLIDTEHDTYHTQLLFCFVFVFFWGGEGEAAPIWDAAITYVFMLSPTKAWCVAQMKAFAHICPDISTWIARVSTVGAI